jgi:VCBS repeat-containing protein
VRLEGLDVGDLVRVAFGPCGPGLTLTVKQSVNTPATITGTSTASVAEDGTLVGSGTLTVIDPDAGQNKFAAPATSALNGTYGTFTFNANTGAWTYTLNNTSAAVQALNGSDTRTETLTVTSLDGTATRAITMTITGQDEATSGALFVSVDGRSGGRAWLDTDRDGVLDTGETVLTLDPSRDSSNTLRGVDFSTKQVTVAFWQFDGPTIDLAGFDSDDKVMMDFTRWGDSLEQEAGVQGIYTGSNIMAARSKYSTRGLKMTNIRGGTESCVFMVDWASSRSIDLKMLSRPMVLFSSGSTVVRSQIDITWPDPLGAG